MRASFAPAQTFLIEVCSMTAAGISNAIVAFALVALVHGLLIQRRVQEERRTADKFAPAPFADSFIKAPDPVSEMFDFANNDESWAACDVKMKPPPPSGPSMPTTMCQRAEASYTDCAVVNTYDNELASNGGDLGGGLRGYEAMSALSPPW